MIASLPATGFRLGDRQLETIRSEVSRHDPIHNIYHFGPLDPSGVRLRALICIKENALKEMIRRSRINEWRALSRRTLSHGQRILFHVPLA
jgi:hypothetical protein